MRRETSPKIEVNVTSECPISVTVTPRGAGFTALFRLNCAGGPLDSDWIDDVIALLQEAKTAADAFDRSVPNEKKMRKLKP
jgi:hypothetical protein